MSELRLAPVAIVAAHEKFLRIDTILRAGISFDRRITQSRPLTCRAGPCHSRTMRRLDRYDLIGGLIAAFLVALWIAHFMVPPAPPLDTDDNAPPALGGSTFPQPFPR
ncbi:MAG TPA: hypothetical protein VFO61_03980 [Alphaproteobacteria bacterium]|nr:hypothetical protein [Alphaproteobacteria bacterium]